MLDLSEFRIEPQQKVLLEHWSADPPPEEDLSKKQAKAQTLELSVQMDELQEVLYAESKNRLLVILQGLDTSGKDGTIRHVFKEINPLGVMAYSFQKPNSLEASHDFLWRVHSKAPAQGMISIFNRSHYEDVLVPCVHGQLSAGAAERRLEQINQFEDLLVDAKTTILKFFLHIDRAEQRERLQARLDRPDKHWKFQQSDLKTRSQWDDYHKIYEQIFHATSAAHRPWYIIPSNKKWFRNLLISQIIVKSLSSLEMKFPDPPEGIDKVIID